MRKVVHLLSTYWFTTSGFEKFRAEEQRLITHHQELFQELKEIIQMDQHGVDIQPLMTQVDHLSSMIKQLNYMKPQIKIINKNKKRYSPIIEIGSRVKVQYNKEEIVKYNIVGYGETNLNKHCISYTTELAQALIGRSLDEEFEFTHHGLTELITILGIR